MENNIRLDYALNCFEAIKDPIEKMQLSNKSIASPEVMRLTEAHFPILYKSLLEIKQNNIEGYNALVNTIDFKLGLKTSL